MHYKNDTYYTKTAIIENMKFNENPENTYSACVSEEILTNMGKFGATKIITKCKSCANILPYILHM